jgi:hypothetical protein
MASASSKDDGWWLQRKWSWVAVGSTVLFVGTAIIAGRMMQAKYDDLRESCGKAAGVKWTGCSSDEVSALDTRKNIANVFWGLGAAAAVTAGALFFIEGREIAVAPMAGDSTGLAASMRY